MLLNMKSSCSLNNYCRKCWSYSFNNNFNATLIEGTVETMISCTLSFQRPPPRRRIDRSMIGNPTNFQHTGHIGSGDISRDTGRLNALQSQMQSKGGYEMAVKAC
ncbi:Hypothetical predicted protein [Cloeon dipterum]|uniref:CRIB domain-containing protein n=1 Tax=Cloeon dipterum TaxID=197152 RepID=A0A8S1CIT2_9INSE|nr:Hypothetical predicted protein [Cloeon dipterum]